MIWENVSIKIRTTILLQNINLRINKGEALGIIGANGSGKTVLAKAIAGELAFSVDVSEDVFPKKVFVPFHSHLTLSNGHAVYRQQRWNKIDTELLPKVSDEIRKCENSELAIKLLRTFDLHEFMDSFMINLSNGEQRKLELIKALSSNPELLVLDNAYTGLDKNSRLLLTQMLNALIEQKQTMVLTGLTPDDFPSSVNNFINLERGQIKQVAFNSPHSDVASEKLELGSESFIWNNSDFSELINLRGVSLQYESKLILNKISWTVKPDERWVLSGPNGSGKTSLLNLIFGDNPKAYGCDIRLFGKQKGSGESIWDIKKRIGFISPELHQYVSEKQNAVNLICSGFNDVERAVKKPTGYQRDLAIRWLKKLGYEGISEKLFGELSTSAQRIVLFLRTLVKNPPLLILDEPFQGLDAAHIRLLKDLLNEIASQSNCAMIFVTHVPDEVPECFDYNLELKDGVVVRFNSPLN